MTRGSLSWLPQLDVAVVDDGFGAKDIDAETRRGIEDYNNLHLPRPDTLQQTTSIRRQVQSLGVGIVIETAEDVEM